jgi:hypothetical protein
MSAIFEQVGPGVIAVDTEFLRPRLDASHLIVDDGHAAFVDCRTYFSIPNLLAALAAQDLDPGAVDYILLTHIHLDHAGGVGRLAELLPQARVLVHPRGVAHIVDPSILIAATQAVYGEARFAREYGVRELDTARGAFILPTTSPTQFDPVQLHASVERILAYRPKAAYLTHYSRGVDLEKLALDLHSEIDAYVAMTVSVAQTADREQRLRELLFEHLAARLTVHGFSGDASRQHAFLDGDIVLNAAGLEAWLSRRRS